MSFASVTTSVCGKIPKERKVRLYFRVPIHNARAEGLNNKAKIIIHKAFGFLSAQNYIRNLNHCMGDPPPPPTMNTVM